MSKSIMFLINPFHFYLHPQSPMSSLRSPGLTVAVLEAQSWAQEFVQGKEDAPLGKPSGSSIYIAIEHDH